MPSGKPRLPAKKGSKEMNRSQQVFGEPVRFYAPILEKVYAFALENTVEYGFVEEERFRKIAESSPSRMIQIYWQEILLRAHMAAMTSLLRSRSWLLGFVKAVDDGNSLVFAGCFRGFLEAASDTYDALGDVPEGLVENRKGILGNLKGKEPFFGAEQLESQLIHFLVAREAAKGESLPPSHRKKQTADYFESVDKSRQGPIRELYRELCEFTHPSKASVDLFFDVQPNGVHVLSATGKPDLAEALVCKHHDAVETAFFCGINICLLTLKVLNSFPLEQLHTPLLDSFRFDRIPLGKRIAAKLGRKDW